ncbi:MAG: peptide chain release factor 1 [Candidatus Omnitrophota bacterium]
MFEKLDEILGRFRELQKLAVDPDVVQNMALYQKYRKEMSGIKDIAGKYERYIKIKNELDDLARSLNEHDDEPEFKAMVTDEIATLRGEVARIGAELEDELYEQDPNASRNIIMEIRAGTGGVEAALFAAELYRMYTKYAAGKGWVFERLGSATTEKGGIKEIVFSISGDSVYGLMKYEIGTHRVQRVPETESSGRIHTSAATVAVLPEAEEIDLKINPQDLKIDVFRAGGRGGQHVNVTDSAVRITHLPSGLVVSCQDERSQHKNKAKAMRVLRSRLFDKMQENQRARISKERKMQVGTGDRSEKIRTYNYPDGRVTDHRIGLTLYRLQDILEGDIDEIIDALRKAERELKKAAQ